jgi:hypothetical protein
MVQAGSLENVTSDSVLGFVLESSTTALFTTLRPEGN